MLVRDTRQKSLAFFLVDSLDDDGYLRTDLLKLEDDFSFARGMIIEPEELHEALKLVQQCEPRGVGARSLKECLLIQLHALPYKDDVHQKAIMVIEKNFHDLT